jgi:hypothetical protein
VLTSCDSGDGPQGPAVPTGTWEAFVPIQFDTTIASTGARYHVEVNHRVRLEIPSGDRATYTRSQEGFFTYAAPGGNPSGTVPIDLNVRTVNGGISYAPPTLVIAGGAEIQADLTFLVGGGNLSGQTTFLLPRSGFVLGPHSVDVSLAPVP